MAYDDAEFAEGAVPGARPSILTQYDKEKKSAPKFTLGEGGSMEVEEDEPIHPFLQAKAGMIRVRVS
jgi:hypothetical protein